jgi:hypothetical protein
MEMSPDAWVAMLVVAGVVGGAVMWWGTSRRQGKDRP